MAESASTVQLIGAGAFGVVIGWLLFYVNRYRRGDVGLGDLTVVLGAIGGGAILALFPAGSDLFGAYGIGLFTGFFAYLGVLAVLVGRSKSFDWDFFLDGRRRALGPDEVARDEERPPMEDSVGPFAR